MRNDVEFRGFKDYLKSIFKSRATYVGLLVAGIVGVLIWRLYSMQIVNGEEYRQKAAETVLTTAELTVKQLVPFGLTWSNTTVISLLLVIAACVSAVVVARVASPWLAR